MLRTIFATKITKTGFVTHRCARFFADFACYAQDFFPIWAGAPQQRCATLRWHIVLHQKGNASFRKSPFFLTKISRSLHVRNRTFLFLASFSIFLNAWHGPFVSRLCHLKVGGAFHEPFVKRTKKMYGPNPKTFRVGPYKEIFRCDRLVCRTICCERIPTLKKYFHERFTKAI